METGKKVTVIVGTAGAGLIIYGISRLLAKPPVEEPAVEVGLTWD